MEDKHLIADIIAKRLEETPKIDGVNINRLIEYSGLPAYKVIRVIEELIDMNILEYNQAKVAVMLTPRFVYGYRFESKRAWYDNLDGESISVKIKMIGEIENKISKQAWDYIIGRMDEACFSSGYI